MPKDKMKLNRILEEGIVIIVILLVWAGIIWLVSPCFID